MALHLIRYLIQMGIDPVGVYWDPNRRSPIQKKATRLLLFALRNEIVGHDELQFSRARILNLASAQDHDRSVYFLMYLSLDQLRSGPELSSEYVP